MSDRHNTNFLKKKIEIMEMMTKTTKITFYSPIDDRGEGVTNPKSYMTSIIPKQAVIDNVKGG